MLNFIRHEFTRLSPLPTDSTSPKFSPTLLEHMFQFFVMFWREPPTHGLVAHTPLVHLSDVLGIHSHEPMFRRAYDYTPYLAALTWAGRLIILEYDLPLRAYTGLPVLWPGRTTYPNQLWRIREDICPKYLQRGSASPMGYLVERFQHGRAIARRDGPRT